MANQYTLRSGKDTQHAQLSGKKELGRKKAFEMCGSECVEEITKLQVDLNNLAEEERKLELQLEISLKREAVKKLRSKLSANSNDNDTCNMNSPSPMLVTNTNNKDAAAHITLKDLSNDKKLEEMLRSLKDEHLEFMEPGLITDGKKSASPCKGKYYITDFVNIPTKSSITAANPDKQKRVEDVTIPQWISANVKILQKLMAEGMSQENVIKYLRYTSKIGDYLQTSDQSSVMLLDNEHRRQVYEEHRDWDSIDGDKVYFHLKSLTTRWQKKSTYMDDKSKPTCIRFNRGTCFYQFCKYQHVCEICKGNHPKTQHVSQAPPYVASYQPEQPLAPQPPQPNRFRHF